MPTKPKTFQMRPKPSRPDNRPSAHHRGYDRQWQRIRRRILNREPLCRTCATEGRHVAAHHVDHAVALNAGGTNDESNLIPLCHSCHSRKTVQHDGGLGHAKAPDLPRSDDPVPILFPWL